MTKFIIAIALLLITAFSVTGQDIPLNNTYTSRIIQEVQKSNLPVQTSMKPMLVQDLDTIMNIDSVLYPVVNADKVRKHWFTRKLFSENLIRFRYDKAYIYIDPLFDFSVGYDSDGSKTIWNNTRGFMVSGGIGRQVTFTSEFYENQAVFPAYMDSIIGHSFVVPGYGDPKRYKENGYDYFYCNASLNYVPSKYLNFTLGYGKNFIGDGYRSMLLSDGAFCYPYLRIDANFWKIKYSILYAQMIDMKTKTEIAGFDRKWVTMHYLQLMLWKRLNIGLFDAIVWKNADSTGYRGFDIQYLNPIIFLRPIEESLGSPDNAMIGATFNVRASKHLSVYGQLFLDEFKFSEMKAGDGWWANKYGFQLGISGWNLFNIDNLNVKLEYNQARPYTYSSDTSVKAYGHYNQPLAHQLGANFKEGLGIMEYRYKHWSATFKLTYAMYGADTNNIDFGQDIFRNYYDHPYEYGNTTGQGLRTTVLSTDTRIAFLLNPRTNMRIEACLFTRNLSSSKDEQSTVVVSIGFKTSLMNFYNDF